ncbi:O-acetylhomoserine sulfhydrylase [Epichloe bromicola]
MRTHDPLKTEEAQDAAWEAGKGALVGAAKWGAGAAVLGGIGYVSSPIYRGTTVQFKVYLQMSGMVLGGMIEADWRLRQYESQMRMQRRWMREKAKWQRYEEEFGKDEGNK